MAEYTEQMRRAWERDQADGRARVHRLIKDIRSQQRSPAEKIYGASSPDGRVQRLRSIAGGKRK
jgi:alkanesulfonate monooxygenase SsuD/methylene tetrahydromethanopterin reductase-like flavin-dependent oxidoreductase (luciferase family)